jgi:transcriptional regulator with XRE-family HTH domain
MQLFVDILCDLMYILYMTLAEKLQKLRKKSKLSMSQVARMSGKASDRRGRITQGYISRLESGKETNPSLMKLMTLCGIYKIQPNEIFVKATRKPRKSK